MSPSLIGRCFVVVAALLCSGVAAAKDLDASARELLARSGLEKQLESFPGLVQMGMQQARLQSKLRSEQAGNPGMPDADYQGLVDAMVKAFDPAALKKVVLARFKADLKQADIDATLAWLNSPLGRRITQLEEQGSTTEAMTAMQVWAANLAKDPPSDERLARVRRLDATTHASEFSASMMRNAQLAILSAMTAHMPEAERQKAHNAVVASLDQNAEQIKASAAQSTLVSLLYVYRSLTDAEFDQQLAFLESPAGRKYSDTSLKAVDEAVVQASHNTGKAFGEVVKRNRKPG